MEPSGEERPLIGTSPPFVRMMTAIDQIAGTAVLLLGEAGTRKELVARTIHERSPRHEHPFVAIHCAAYPEGLMECELFGYLKGVWGGPAERKAGAFELANGGTLFLDEIGLLPAPIQVFLVLMHEAVQRPGRAKTVRPDVRIVSATNQDLAQMCREKLFRHDLYSSLSGVTVHVPPLRERGGGGDPGMNKSWNMSSSKRSFS